MQVDATARLNFLDEKIVRELNRMLSHAGTSVMPHVLAIQLGIQYSEGLAIIALLSSEGLCSARLLIYHRCEPDLPAGVIPLKGGLPQLPWRCPNCEELVESYTELAFDVEALLLYPVEVA